MNLFKIVQKRTDKGSSKSSLWKDAGTVLLFVFLLPYVISCLWGHAGEDIESIAGGTEEEREWIDEKYELTLIGNHGSRKLSMRDYLIKKLELIMGEGEEGDLTYEPEALKAQAVLLRTQVWGLILKDENNVTIQDDIDVIDTTINKINDYEAAVSSTDGIFLSYENYPVKAAFFPVSSGYTRDAAEVWNNGDYPYLVSVECKKDITAQNFQSQKTVSMEEFEDVIKNIFNYDEASENELNIKYKNIEYVYDSAGYVIEAKLGEHSCDGETFRNAFGLNSACFYTDSTDDEVIFHVKGVGHGFGMSQFGANERAISGENFDEILKYYFLNTELAKIE